jgi:hypothetical protein
MDMKARYVGADSRIEDMHEKMKGLKGTDQGVFSRLQQTAES